MICVNALKGATLISTNMTNNFDVMDNLVSMP